MKKSFARVLIVCLILLAAVAAAGGGLHYYTSRYDELIRQAAARNGLDFYLVKSLIYEESWFRSGIRGPAGEMGLMQITPAAAEDFSVFKGFPLLESERLLEPELNVEIGCWYLKKSLQRYRNTPNPVLYALLRYNAGETRADSWLKQALAEARPSALNSEEYHLSVVDFPKTRAYAKRILHRSRTRNFYF